MNVGFALPVALIISLIALFLTSPFLNLPNLLSVSLHECGHVILVSAPRHGSTWLLDSVEGCPSRQTKSGNYRDLIFNSELWTAHQGPVHNISASEAARYVARNFSVKIFPGVYRRNTERVMTLFEQGKEMGLPVFLLRRRPEDSYRSLLDASENHNWITNSLNQPKERELVELDDRFERYSTDMEKYFVLLESKMKDIGLEWDALDYEDVRGMPEIIGQRNGCVIKNCNFV